MTSLKASLPKTLTTQRLTLEAWNDSLEYKDAFLANMNNPTSHARMGDYGIRTHEAVDKLIENLKFKSDDLCPGKKADCCILYMARLKLDSSSSTDAPLIGAVSLVHRTSDVPPDLGWSVLEAYMGQGYATEAAKELLRFATEDLGMTQIIAAPRTTNKESIRVAEKLGLMKGPEIRSEEGWMEAAYLLPGMSMREDVVFKFHGE